MKNVALVYRPHSPQAIKMAKSIIHWLQKRKVNVYTAAGQKLLPHTRFASGKVSLSKLSFVLVLGGDGTYLRAVRFLNGLPIPVLGVNMGSLGFLTSFQSGQIFEVLEKTLNDEMDIAERMMLDVSVLRGRKKRTQALALNDVVIERGSYSQLINTSISSSRKFVSEIKADGIIVSSPTGSTAYNLAAGGPLVDPELNALLITPVAPHALTSRPLIFPVHRKLSFSLGGKSQTAKLIVDGQEELDLTYQDEVLISKAKNPHYLIQSKQPDFFRLLREKLKFGDRA